MHARYSTERSAHFTRRTAHPTPQNESQLTSLLRLPPAAAAAASTVCTKLGGRTSRRTSTPPELHSVHLSSTLRLFRSTSGQCRRYQLAGRQAHILQAPTATCTPGTSNTGNHSHGDRLACTAAPGGFVAQPRRPSSLARQDHRPHQQRR